MGSIASGLHFYELWTWMLFLHNDRITVCEFSKCTTYISLLLFLFRASECCLSANYYSSLMHLLYAEYLASEHIDMMLVIHLA